MNLRLLSLLLACLLLGVCTTKPSGIHWVPAGEHPRGTSPLSQQILTDIFISYDQVWEICLKKLDKAGFLFYSADKTAGEMKFRSSYFLNARTEFVIQILRANDEISIEVACMLYEEYLSEDSPAFLSKRANNAVDRIILTLKKHLSIIAIKGNLDFSLNDHHNANAIK